ncbi:hypothetical protein K501DRAFT_47014 [Backusella circina FSU 941]|nr:hypothetical protein K501DRAFT_47014 [Backusella circina FSU 941]
MQVRDKMTTVERKSIQEYSNRNIPVLAIGNKGTGVESHIRGYNLRRGDWIKELHGRYTIAVINDEHMTSQLCIYCYSPIFLPKNADGSKNLGTTRYLNLICASVIYRRASDNLDQMSATGIGIPAMTRLLGTNFPPFTPSNKQ